MSIAKTPAGGMSDNVIYGVIQAFCLLSNLTGLGRFKTNGCSNNRLDERSRIALRADATEFETTKPATSV
jgi:hypothetical protein